MRVFTIHPRLTLGDHEQSLNFYTSCKNELENHVEVTPIGSEMVLRTARPVIGDIILFFNGESGSYTSFFLSFLEKARLAHCSITPIAITETYRTPPLVVSQSQSFDVQENLRQRKLTEVQTETVAVTLARKVIAQLQPTLSRDNMLLFLSYRRFDGEHISGAFHDGFQVRMNKAFRDLNGIVVGADAQDVILQRIRQCNSVIFLDTPKSGESDWIATELQIALSLNIPIVWVKIGPDDGRVDLKVKPMGEPHFRFPELGMSSRDIDPVIVDDVLHRAFEICREFALNVLSDIQRIMELNRKGDIVVEELDPTFLTYEVRIPRISRYRYTERPMTHVIGFYGRIPDRDDQRLFFENVVELGYLPHRVHHYQYYDSAIMLAPIPPKSQDTVSSEQHEIVDSCEEYITSLENYLRSRNEPVKAKQAAVIISGAFPDCEPEHQQHITDAVHSFCRAVMDRGGTVIFGAHPTFQHLIFDMARQHREDPIDAVHMYVSKHFVTDSMINESRESATVTATDDIDGDRAQSLTLMRQTMIEDEQAVCMVVIGGKTLRPGIPPGVDEEIMIARNRGLPVFLVGSAGGRTAELASQHASTGWKDKPNEMTDEFNHELMVSMNYSLLADQILNHLGI